MDPVVEPTLNTSPRTFVLDRHYDVSKVSDTGIVAEGVVFGDGAVALRWPGENATTRTFVTVPLLFDQEPARSTTCGASSRGRSLSQRSGTSLTRFWRRSGSLPRAGERARSDWAAPRSPFHPEALVRGSRSAPLPSSSSAAPRRGRCGPISRGGGAGRGAL